MTEVAENETNWLEKSFGLLLILYALVAPLSISAIYIALGLIIVAGIALIIRKGWSNITFKMNLLVPFCLLFGWSAMTALMAGSFSSETAFRGIKELSPIVLFPVFLQAAKPEKEKIIMTLLVSASLVCLFGLIQYFNPSVTYPLKRQLIFEGEYRGLFSSHNHFGSGGFYSMTTVISFALILFWHCGRVKKLFLWVFFLLNIAALSLTFARTYYVSVAAVILLLLLLKNWRWFTLGVILTVSIISLILSFPSNVNSRIRSIVDMKNSSNMDRQYIWKVAVEMIKEHSVVGVGRGNWESQARNVYWPRFKKEAALADITYVNAHNVYLYILAETGIIGLFIFISLWGGIILEFFKGLRLDQDPFNIPLIAGTSAALCNILIAGLFECNFETVVVLLLISFLVGISMPSIVKVK